MRRLIALSLVVALTQTIALAQTVPATAYDPKPKNFVHPRPLPQTQPSVARPTKIDHLQKAAEHLEAAGLKEQARELRKKVQEERKGKQALLAKKFAELAALQKEINQLRHEVGGRQQILVNIKVIEVSLSKARRMGFGFASVDAGRVITSGIGALLDSEIVGKRVVVAGRAASAPRKAVTIRIVENRRRFDSLFEMLRKNGIAKVLAEPTLVTVSGRPASFQVGHEFPVFIEQPDSTPSVESQFVGTRVDVAPLVLDNGNIRLEIHPRISRIDGAHSAKIDGQTVPTSVRVVEIDTTVELKSGQTVVLTGLIQKRAGVVATPVQQPNAQPQKDTKTEETQIIVLATAELVGPRVAAENTIRSSPPR